MPPKKRAAGGDEGGAKKKINKGHIAALLASLGAAVVWAQFAPGSAKVAPAYISLTTLLCTVIAGAAAAGATHLQPTEQAHSDFLTAVQAVAQHNTAAKIFDSPLHAWWDSYKLKRAKNNITAANIAAIDQPIPLSALHQMAKLLADTVFEPFCKLGLNGAPPSEPNEGPGGTTDNPKPSAAKPANPTANPSATTTNATVDNSNNTTLAATVINGGAPTGTKPTSSASLAATAAQALATNALHPTNAIPAGTQPRPEHTSNLAPALGVPDLPMAPYGPRDIGVTDATYNIINEANVKPYLEKLANNPFALSKYFEDILGLPGYQSIQPAMREHFNFITYQLQQGRISGQGAISYDLEVRSELHKHCYLAKLGHSARCRQPIPDLSTPRMDAFSAIVIEEATAKTAQKAYSSKGRATTVATDKTVAAKEFCRTFATGGCTYSKIRPGEACPRIHKCKSCGDNETYSANDLKCKHGHIKEDCWAGAAGGWRPPTQRR